MRTVPILSAAALAAAAVALTVASNPSTAAEPVPSARSAAGEYSIDVTHSSLLFKCQHLDVNYQWGRFDEFGGSFKLSEDAAESSVKVEVEAASVNTAAEKRDEHLRGPDFFDVKQFPKMTFESKKVESKGDGEFTITGDLTLHGTTKEITFDATKVGEADTRMGRRCGFEGSFVIDRMEYGVDTMGEMLGHDVTMTFAIEGVAESR